jgi:hypothetical protein
MCTTPSRQYTPFPAGLPLTTAKDSTMKALNTKSQTHLAATPFFHFLLSTTMSMVPTPAKYSFRELGNYQEKIPKPKYRYPTKALPNHHRNVVDSIGVAPHEII